MRGPARLSSPCMKEVADWSPVRIMADWLLAAMHLLR